MEFSNVILITVSNFQFQILIDLIVNFFEKGRKNSHKQDDIRGYASKSAHSHVIRWLIDRLSTRICFKVCAFWKSILPRNKLTKLGQLRPTYGHSNRASYKTKVKTESKMVSYKKKWKNSTSNVYSINQSTIALHGSAQTLRRNLVLNEVSQPLNNMGVRRLWVIFSYSIDQSTIE